MVRSTEVVAGSPSAVVVKRATGADVLRLRAEGQRLATAAHPGVVQLVSSAGTSDEWELRLVHAGRPLDVLGVLPVTQVAAVVAAVAATLADLHERGTVHGRVDASHVLIGRHGRPVLCGLGPEPVGSTPADDVADVGALLGTLLGAGADMEPIPERRWLPRPSWSGWERRSLLLLADQACADPPTRRPTARRLAAAITDAVPGAALTGPTPATTDEPPVARDPIEILRSTASADVHTPPRLSVLAGALVGVVVLGAGALGSVRTQDRDGAVPSAAVEHAISPSTTSSTTPTSIDLQPTTTITSPTPLVPCVVLSTTATAPGACIEPVRVDGTMVLVGSRRYEVGQPGDHVVLGDWDCDGSATPAALRPSTGEVFVFPTWAATGAVLVRPMARVPNAAMLLVEGDTTACSTLVVRRADGTQVAVTTERSV